MLGRQSATWLPITPDIAAVPHRSQSMERIRSLVFISRLFLLDILPDSPYTAVRSDSQGYTYELSHPPKGN